MNEGGQNIMKL